MHGCRKGDSTVMNEGCDDYDVGFSFASLPCSFFCSGPFEDRYILVDGVSAITIMIIIIIIMTSFAGRVNHSSSSSRNVTRIDHTDTYNKPKAKKKEEKEKEN